VEERPAASAGAQQRPIGPEAAPATPARQLDPRIATVLGGGRCRQPRGFILNLLEPSERTAEQIVRHVNARFPDTAAGKREPGVITLKVPARYQDDKAHFLEVVGGIYLSDSPELVERRMRELTEKLRAGRDLRRVSAALEALGQTAATPLEQLLGDQNATVRFYAAQTLARLGRPSAVPALEKLLRDDASPLQEDAVRAVGEMEGNAAAALLKEALHARSPRARIAAYLALVQKAPQTLRAVQIPDKLELGEIASRGAAFIYVGRELEPRVVVFGEARLRPPLLADTSRYLISASEGATSVTVMNKWYGPQCRMQADLDVVSVVAAMVGPLRVTPDSPKPKAVDLSYSDVVGLLDQASRSGALKVPVVFEPMRAYGMPPVPRQPGGPETDIVLPPR